MSVDGQFRFYFNGIAMFIHLTGFQVADQLQFVGLVFKDLFGLPGVHHFAREFKFSFDDLTHALLDFFQILRGKRAGQVEVIVKTVFDRWADRDFCVREFIQYGLRHHVRS